ncbi:probable G-protein coupled receptor Mth-like 3 isoform X2 [Nylanderia fulva]|nr:probable G-protein coupled receptor Mth-like 3 isoform X2 [Nylanderia fulva]
MFVQNFTFLCCGLFLLIISSSKPQRNYSNNEDESHNSTVRYETYADSATIYSDEIKPMRYDLYEKFTDDTEYNEMEYEFSTISTNIDRENVDSKLSKLRRRFAHNHENDDELMYSHINSTNVDHEENSTSLEVYDNLLEKNNSMSNKVFENSIKYSNESNIVPYETCHNITCIQFCCSLGSVMRLNDTKCVLKEMKYVFPNVYEYANDSTQNKSKRVDEYFQLTVYDPCLEMQRYVVPDGHQYEYKIFANGSIYFTFLEKFVELYCLVVFLERGNRFEVTYCSEHSVELEIHDLEPTFEYIWKTRIKHIYSSLLLVCSLFYLAIFLVYSILPELRNEHGFLLCNFSAVSSIVIIIEAVRVLKIKEDVSYLLCITIAFLEYYFSVSCCCWQSIMIFNIWHTFRGFSSLQRNVRQSGKKKLMYYAIFAYGCPIVFATYVVVVDFVSEYIPNILRPEFKMGSCWFSQEHLEALTLYYYWIITVCTISSICLCFSTARNIKRYEKDANFSLTDSESKQYNNNKK